MSTNVKNISKIVKDIKEILTDDQYKSIMVLNNRKKEVEKEETDEELS